MYVKKFTSFCQALKRCTQKKIGSFFSASRCIFRRESHGVSTWRPRWPRTSVQSPSVAARSASPQWLSGAEPQPRGVQGHSPRSGGQWAKPLWGWEHIEIQPMVRICPFSSFVQTFESQNWLQLKDREIIDISRIILHHFTWHAAVFQSSNPCRWSSVLCRATVVKLQ